MKSKLNESIFTSALREFARVMALLLWPNSELAAKIAALQDRQNWHKRDELLSGWLGWRPTKARKILSQE